MRLVRRPLTLAAGMGIVLMVAVSLASALYLGVFSPHPRLALDTFNDLYGTAGTRLDSCKTCHTAGRNTNPYGTQLKSEFSGMVGPDGRDLTERQAIDGFITIMRAVEGMDSDNDGVSNIEEIQARTFPGDPADHP